MDVPAGASSFALLPECEARALLGGRPLRLLVLRPPYPALGVGVLRVLRVAERDPVCEIVAGYERYERLTSEPAQVTS